MMVISVLLYYLKNYFLKSLRNMKQRKHNNLINKWFHNYPYDRIEGFMYA